MTRRTAARRHSLSCAALVFAGLVETSACSDGKTPSLQDMRFLGQAKDSPVVLLIETDFVDPDGDLGHGLLETFIDGRTTSLGRLDLAPIFVDSGLEFNSEEGTLHFVFELAVDEQSLPESGTRFTVGVRAQDADGNLSQTAQIALQLTYE
jgi:hypothetical protein